MLIWEIIFIKLVEGKPEIIFSRKYENGQPVKNDPLPSEKEIFINYISLFPAKDIQRISLGLHGNLLYNFYYIDKTFYDKGFLGLFGCAEYNTQRPYDWEEVDLIAKYLHREYFKRLSDGLLSTPEGAQEYIDWMDEQIKEYYEDFLNAKDNYYQNLANKTKVQLADAFSSISILREQQEGEKKEKRRIRERLKRKDDLSLNQGESVFQGAGKGLKLREVKHEEEVITEEEAYWLKLERTFSIMLLNSYGNPLTDVLTFKNGEPIEGSDEEAANRHILESMTYSVLNSFVGKQKLNLKSMKVRKPGDLGFEFILFRTIKIKGQIYLVIMTVENYDPEKGVYIGKLHGNEEERLLDRIAMELAEKEEWFREDGCLDDLSLKKEVESLFYRNIRRQFI